MKKLNVLSMSLLSQDRVHIFLVEPKSIDKPFSTLPKLLLKYSRSETVDWKTF